MELKCPKCGALLRLPTTTSAGRFKCGGCQTVLKAPPSPPAPLLRQRVSPIVPPDGHARSKARIAAVVGASVCCLALLTALGWKWWRVGTTDHATTVPEAVVAGADDSRPAGTELSNPEDGSKSATLAPSSSPQPAPAGKPPASPPDPTPLPLPIKMPEQPVGIVDKSAPTVLVPVLRRTHQVDFELPRTAGRQGPHSADWPPPTGQKLSLEEIKKAVCLIKVQTDEGAATGSGFLIKADEKGGLVATNSHVVAGAMIARKPTQVPRVKVVFDSGQPSEYAADGLVVAVNPDSDLAVIRVSKVAKMPRPIDPRSTPKLTETMSVLICGFPFGTDLATGGRGPAITIGKGAISSVRRDDAGEVVLVQIDGAINPGNSGGPIIDSDGRLCGIAVATIKGSGIGMAIPATELVELLHGQVSLPVLLSQGVEGDKALFQVLALVADPLQRLETVSLYSIAGDARLSQPRLADGWAPLSGAEKLDLKLETPSLGAATLQLPARNELLVTLQLTCRYKDGAAITSRPVPFKLHVAAVQTADDAMPLTVLNRTPEKYQDKTVVFRANLFPGVVQRGGIRQLQVMNEKNVRPMNLEFFTSAEIATQLGELPFVERMLPVRMTGRVGARQAGGIAPVEVSRIDFIGGQNRLVRTVPSNDGLKDPLIALNRAPANYLGKTLVLPALLHGGIVMRGQEVELQVMMTTKRRPDNLHFTAARDLVVQLHDEGLRADGLHPARLTGRVENRRPDNRQGVTILKIELLDGQGQVQKTIE